MSEPAAQHEDERRPDGTQHVTISGLPGFHFILKSDEQFVPPLKTALEEFLSLYLDAYAARKVAEARRAERERCAQIILDWITKQRATGADNWHTYGFEYFEAVAATIRANPDDQANDIPNAKP